MATKRPSSAERRAQVLAPFLGRWHLTGFASDDRTIEAVPLHSWQASVSRALFASSRDLLPSVVAATGLTLTVHDDQRFEEVAEGAVSVPWAGVDGVLSAEAAPFAGVIVVPSVGRNCVSLRPEAKAAWLPKPVKDGPSLRYLDGDTRVYDSLSVVDGGLLRGMHVVTDDLYLRRIALTYAPER